VAEVRIEERSGGRTVWPWVAVLLLVVAALWAVTEWAEQPDLAAGVESAEERAGAAATAASRDYHDFARALEDDADGAALDPDRLAEGMSRLLAALEAEARRDPAGAEALERQLDVVRQQAERAADTASPYEQTTHFRGAFTSAAAFIERAREQRRPRDGDLQRRAAAVQQAAGAIADGESIRNQGEPVRRFFLESAEALRLLAAPDPA
jgi:hypothetical protein